MVLEAVEEEELDMPFTPFHFGANSCIAFLFKKYIDFPVFIIINVIVDLEPLAVMLFNLRYPVHGYCHTFLVGSLIGALAAILFYFGKGLLKGLMKLLHLPYDTSLRKILFSSVLGVWFHVLLDAPLYSDIRPFYPSINNPLYGRVEFFIMYLTCTILFIPAFILYMKNRLKR